MKVISTPDVSNFKLNIKCPTCKSELEVIDDDIYIEHGYYLDYFEIEGFLINCAVCSHSILLNDNVVPFFIKESIRNRKKKEPSWFSRLFGSK
jgi:hypothetical protein